MFQSYENSQPPTTSNSFPTTVIPLDDLTVSQTSSKKQPPSSTEKVKSKLSTVTSNSASSKQNNMSNSNSGNSNGKKKDNNQKPIHESDVDMENLPVIQGSFEITKTDADIAQKRSNANQKPASTQSSVTSTLKPFIVSPASTIRIKSHHEKPLAPKSTETTTKTATTRAPVTSTTTMTTTKTATDLHLRETATVGIAKIEKTNIKGSGADEKLKKNFSTSSPILKTLENTFGNDEEENNNSRSDEEEEKELPKLDVSLFTSAPILDEQPWRPIQPVPNQIKSTYPNQITTSTTATPTTISSSNNKNNNEKNIFESPTDSLDIFRSPFKPNPPENVLFRNKFVDPVNDTNDSSVFYQSFYNPNFSAGDLAIEKLGIDTLRPYPLPVNKIDLNENQNSPQFKPLGEDDEIKKNGSSNSKTDKSDDIKINYDEEKFEHLGGGVIAMIAKKPETNDSYSSKVLVVGNVNDTHRREGEIIHHGVVVDNEGENENLKNVTESTANLSDIFQELLDLEGADEALNFTMTDNNKLESRIISDDSIEDISSSTEQQQILTSPSTSTLSSAAVAEKEKLNFMNMKEFIVQMQKNKSSDEVENSSEMEKDDDEDDNADVENKNNDDGGVRAIFGDSKTLTKTTEKSTTTYVEVETLKYTPTSAPITHSTMASLPQLFPEIVHKWEFVNGTSTNSTETSMTKKIFNETLQAVVVENSQTTSPPPSSSLSNSQKQETDFDDFKANRTGDDKPTDLQELSSIFDTLFPKLGMKPIDTASKTPPFAQQNNKLKNNNNNSSRNRTTTKKINSNNTTPISKQRPAANKLSSQTKAHATTTKFPLTTTKSSSTHRKSTSATPATTMKDKLFTSSGSSSEVGVIGEAEVEPVDPTQYDEMLSLATSSTFSRIPSSTTPSLITLLPAKSNSGIRNFNPRLKLASRTSNSQQSSGEQRKIELPKNFVVKTSMTFDA